MTMSEQRELIKKDFVIHKLIQHIFKYREDSKMSIYFYLLWARHIKMPQ